MLSLWLSLPTHRVWKSPKSETNFWKECIKAKNERHLCLQNYTHKIVHSSAMHYQIWLSFMNVVLYRYWPWRSWNITFRWTAKKVIFSQGIIFSRSAQHWGKYCPEGKYNYLGTTDTWYFIRPGRYLLYYIFSILSFSFVVLSCPCNPSSWYNVTFFCLCACVLYVFGYLCVNCLLYFWVLTIHWIVYTVNR